MLSIIFWDVMKCSPVEIHDRFGGTYCLPLQNRRVSQQRVGGFVCCLLLAGYVLGLLFDPEDGDSTFPRNVNQLLPDYTKSIPRK
jgi:hypothetical protein